MILRVIKKDTDKVEVMLGYPSMKDKDGNYVTNYDKEVEIRTLVRGEKSAYILRRSKDETFFDIAVSEKDEKFWKE